MPALTSARCAARHLLATANKASQSAAAVGPSLHRGPVPADVDSPQHPPDDTTSDSPVPFATHTAPGGKSAQHSTVSSNRAVRTGVQATLGATEGLESHVSISRAMSGVVWNPDRGLSVPESQECAAGDAEAYRERLDQSEQARRTCDSSPMPHLRSCSF